MKMAIYLSSSQNQKTTVLLIMGGGNQINLYGNSEDCHKHPKQKSEKMSSPGGAYGDIINGMRYTGWRLNSEDKPVEI